jgi:hypothetical protein
MPAPMQLTSQRTIDLQPDVPDDLNNPLLAAKCS